MQMICAISAGIIPPVVVDVYAKFIDEIINAISAPNISGDIIEVLLLLIFLKVIEQISITFFPYIQELLSIKIEKKVQENIIKR